MSLLRLWAFMACSRANFTFYLLFEIGVTSCLNICSSKIIFKCTVEELSKLFLSLNDSTAFYFQEQYFISKYVRGLGLSLEMSCYSRHNKVKRSSLVCTNGRCYISNALSEVEMSMVECL
jgi:hypothetical protein